MSLSIKAGPKLPPAYKGTPEEFIGTVFAVGEAQSTKYIPGQVGAPIPDVWQDGNPKMQVVIYLVGQSGKAMRMFVGKSKNEGSAWQAWVKVIQELGSESFEIINGKTFHIKCKTTYKPGGKEIAFREWGISPVEGQDYRPSMEDEWKELPQGILETFYYPGFSPAERAAAPAAAAPAAVATPQAPVAATPTAAAPTPAAPVTPTLVGAEAVYDEEIPF